MSFTMVNFLYLFYTIVKDFYLSKLLSVTSTNIHYFDNVMTKFMINNRTDLHFWAFTFRTRDKF